jgi:hypothetical protein
LLGFGRHSPRRPYHLGMPDPRFLPVIRPLRLMSATTRLGVVMLLAVAWCAGPCSVAVAVRPAADGGIAETKPASAATKSKESDAAPAAPEADADRHTLDRIVFIGASATDGFGTQLLAKIPDSGRIVRGGASFDDVFAAGLQREPALIRRFSTSMFFTRPRHFGREQIDAAKALDPTLVIAVDFPFWFGYGNVGVPNGTDEEIDRRLALLEMGLAMLDELDCPTIIGDFPDMSAAVGFMLSARQMPSPKALAALNERVRAWIDERDHACHFPLARLTVDMKAGRELEIAGHTWEADEVGKLISPDELHPTILGLVALAQQTSAILAANLDDVSADDFQTEPEAVLKALKDELIAKQQKNDQ